MKNALTIKPLNNRFKRLISDFGTEWVILRGPVSMPCFDGRLGVLCSPASNPSKVSNFKWEEVKNVG